jgi:hypothetical protein
MTAHTLDVDALSEVVLLVNGVLCQAALGPTGRTAVCQDQHGPSRFERGEAIGFPGYVEYYYRVFVGDRALVALPGCPVSRFLPTSFLLLQFGNPGLIP